jgi:type IV pilus assembly protein PilE
MLQVLPEAVGSMPVARAGLALRMRANRGFTLIELLVVLVIVGILAAVGYPSYKNYVVRAGRSAAESYMFQLANRQEQYLLDARSYATAPADLVPVPAEVSKNYTVTIASVTATTYQIKAAPNSASFDTDCQTLTLTQDGTKGSSAAANPSKCW